MQAPFMPRDLPGDPKVPTDAVDVLVVGAGLSGIGAGYHLQTLCPQLSYAIVEARDAIGGTWDLFRYPGIRSDSDMYTLGYRFRPWKGAKAIADGGDILAYVRDTAREHGIDRKIRFGHRVDHASWSSATARWTVHLTKTDGTQTAIRCRFLFMCSGYYDYDAGYTPDFPGIGDFRGSVVHPQKWTDDVDYAGKRVVVIGSGATAVTLVPSLAEKAAHVTMLQRSPSWIMSRPGRDVVADFLRDKLGAGRAHDLTRWKNVLLGMAWFQFCRAYPARARALLLAGVRAGVGKDFDVGTHFTPSYDPWDQRLCLVPDDDLFRAIKAGTVEVVTDHIEAFTETGVKLRSGRIIEADLVVTATGLRVVFMGKATLEVDGKPVEPTKLYNYKGSMFSDVPNFAAVFGYTNASWTLKADLVCEFVCRLLNRMEEKGYAYAVPRVNGPDLDAVPIIDFSSGYVKRALDHAPKQGTRAPWRLYQNYVLDLLGLRYRTVEDAELELHRAP
jgi:monooxygenase